MHLNGFVSNAIKAGIKMVALDTNIYIYFLEKNPKFFSMSERAVKYALKGGAICVPTITLMEIISGTSKSLSLIHISEPTRPY